MIKENQTQANASAGECSCPEQPMTATCVKRNRNRSIAHNFGEFRIVKDTFEGDDTVEYHFEVRHQHQDLMGNGPELWSEVYMPFQVEKFLLSLTSQPLT